jgi:hypothetical protein
MWDGFVNVVRRAPEKPAGLPNIEKVPPMPPCKPPKSDFIQIGNMLIKPARLDAAAFNEEERIISVILYNGETMSEKFKNSEQFEQALFALCQALNIEIKEPTNDDQKTD